MGQRQVNLRTICSSITYTIAQTSVQLMIIPTPPARPHRLRTRAMVRNTGARRIRNLLWPECSVQIDGGARRKFSVHNEAPVTNQDAHTSHYLEQLLSLGPVTELINLRVIYVSVNHGGVT